jgi:restriction endonuclease Mrr
VELRQGRLDDYQCEGLVKGLLESMGAREARIVPRNKDKGADIVATFLVAGVFKITVAVQVRHWQPEPAVQPCHIDELIRGMEAESADLGLFITTGAFSEEAERHAEGKHVELVDGEMLAAMLLESGAFKAGN